MYLFHCICIYLMNQNVFLKAYENYAQVREKEKIRAWLYQITRNEINAYFKRESRYVDQIEEPKRFGAEEQEQPFFAKDFCCFDTFVSELSSDL